MAIIHCDESFVEEGGYSEEEDATFDDNGGGE